nr:MAG TPA: hypothetical protein [Caudoviricetes sp.]DAL06177.1 MAG TPA: hypothetical protein [Caudoviricetes sp.]DAL90847.1 MAG TPA: hypothetical protein [Caudoviricetes sp.]DAM18402.1 MAG TPA: hypothetical protein [Caudoviricetes sp.]DAN50926.1 MAG TPA: hypothetical protein [Caudoviricetes sp.]
MKCISYKILPSCARVIWQEKLPYEAVSTSVYRIHKSQNGSISKEPTIWEIKVNTNQFFKH